MILVVSQFFLLRDTHYEVISDYLSILFAIGFIQIKSIKKVEKIQKNLDSSNFLLLKPNYYQPEALGQVQYFLHLLNPNTELATKLQVALSYINEMFPQKSFSYFAHNSGQISYITGTRTDAEGLVTKVHKEEPLSEEITVKLAEAFKTNHQKFIRELLAVAFSEDVDTGYFIPVSFNGHFYGILTVYDGLQESISNSELLFFQYFAEGLGVVLNNDELYKAQTTTEVTHEPSDMEEYLKDLLKQETLYISGWDLSYLASFAPQGSFCDFVLLPNNDLMIIHGKASFSNYRSSLQLLKLKAMIRCYCENLSTPSELLNRLSYALSEDKSCDVFYNLSAMCISSSGENTLISLAGSSLPIAVRNSSGFAEVLKLNTGVPLGLFNQGKDYYEDFEINLLPQDGIFLYTEDILGYCIGKDNFITEEKLKLELEKHSDLNAQQTLSNLRQSFSKHKYKEDDMDFSFCYVKME